MPSKRTINKPAEQLNLQACFQRCFHLKILTSSRKADHIVFDFTYTGNENGSKKNQSRRYKTWGILSSKRPKTRAVLSSKRPKARAVLSSKRPQMVFLNHLYWFEKQLFRLFLSSQRTFIVSFGSNKVCTTV